MTVKMAMVEFSCVLPAVSAYRSGHYPVLTLAGGEPAGDPDGIPNFWYPSTDSGGVLLRVTYEPCMSLFHFGMNAGRRSRDLHRVSLGPAPLEEYTERVLRFSVLIAPTGLYPDIEEPDSKEEELFGELTLPAPPGLLLPWGVAPTGSWRMVSGRRKRCGQEKSFPPGFGLSDVRVVLLDRYDETLETMRYSGELDHLVSKEWETVPPFDAELLECLLAPGGTWECPDPD